MEYKIIEPIKSLNGTILQLNSYDTQFVIWARDLFSKLAKKYSSAVRDGREEEALDIYNILNNIANYFSSNLNEVELLQFAGTLVFIAIQLRVISVDAKEISGLKFYKENLEDQWWFESVNDVNYNDATVLSNFYFNGNEEKFSFGVVTARGLPYVKE